LHHCFPISYFFIVFSFSFPNLYCSVAFCQLFFTIKIRLDYFTRRRTCSVLCHDRMIAYKKFKHNVKYCPVFGDYSPRFRRLYSRPFRQMFSPFSPKSAYSRLLWTRLYSSSTQAKLSPATATKCRGSDILSQTSPRRQNVAGRQFVARPAIFFRQRGRDFKPSGQSKCANYTKLPTGSMINLQLQFIFETFVWAPTHRSVSNSTEDTPDPTSGRLVADDSTSEALFWRGPVGVYQRL